MSHNKHVLKGNCFYFSADTQKDYIKSTRKAEELTADETMADIKQEGVNK